MANGEASLRQRVRHLVARDRWWPDRLGEIISQTARVTAAAVVAYVAALALSPGAQPLTGPLTAILVVQVTFVSTLWMGFQRVLSVVSGVLLAVLLSSLVGLSWWSLGLIVAASLLVGQLLRLREQLLEVPISGMLILGAGAASPAVSARVIETLVGAGVGVLFNVVLPPALRTRTAAQAVQDVADQAADLLYDAARELETEPSRDQALHWLQRVRDLSHAVDLADRAITEASASRRLNVRSIRRVDNGPILRSGLDALEHTVVALRTMFRAMAEGIRDAEGDEHDYSPELLGAFGVLLRDLALAIRAYGTLIRADADTGTLTTDATAAEALDALREARAVLTELLLIDAGDDPHQWMVRGTLLASVGRVLRELDLEERARQRRRWEESAGSRGTLLPVIGRLRRPSS